MKSSEPDSKNDKRNTKTTGNYDTLAELKAECLRLDSHKKYTRPQIGDMVGVSAGTVTNLVLEDKRKPPQADLKNKLKELWSPTTHEPDVCPYCDDFLVAMEGEGIIEGMHRSCYYEMKAEVLNG
jgi:hypothetical protein